MASKFRTEALYHRLCKEYNLVGWTLHITPHAALANIGSGIFTSKTAMGCCSYANQTIWVSEALVSHGNWDVIEDTVRHEIAHAIAGSRAGHGSIWKMWARKLGANPAARNAVNPIARVALANEPKAVKPRKVPAKRGWRWVITAVHHPATAHIQGFWSGDVGGWTTHYTNVRYFASQATWQQTIDRLRTSYPELEIHGEGGGAKWMQIWGETQKAAAQ